tara:strand:- start:1752 stop:2702 length:951 start_codon:yes stop_codon:yes gene_type:complete
MSYKIIFNLKSLFDLRKNPKILFKFIFLSFILSIIIYFITPREFVSRASVLPSQSDSNNLSAMASLASQFGYNMNQSNNPLTDPNVIKEIAKNDNVSSKILNHIFTSKAGESKEIFYYLYPNKDLNNPLDFESGKKHLNRKVINVYQDIESSIIHFKVTTASPDLSYEICNLVFKDTIAKINSLNSSNNSQKLSFLRERNDLLKLDLSQKQDALKEFQEKNISSKSPALQLEISKLITEIEIIKNIYMVLRGEEETLAVEVNNNNNGIFLINEPYLPIARSYPKTRNLIFIFLFLNLSFIALHIFRNSRIIELIDD